MARKTEFPTQPKLASEATPPWQNPPSGWKGSKPEWSIYWAAERLGYKDGVNVFYQSPYAGGRLNRGGAVIDFVFPFENIGVRVQGVYFHYAKGGDTRAFDQLQKIEIESSGMRVIDIDEDDALRAPVSYLRDALAGIDKSRTSRGV